MTPVFAWGATLFPHLRTGDFGFAVRARGSRALRYAGMALLTLRQRRFPLARALLVAPQPGAWRTLASTASTHEWVPTWLDRYGVHDGFALRAYEDELRRTFRAGRPFMLRLPATRHPMRRYWSMLAVADVAFSCVDGAAATSWWLV